MYPDQRYAPARGSFERPVPPPASGPEVGPYISVFVPCLWLPYVRGALQQLLLQATWATDDPVILTRLQGQAFDLIELFQECSGTPAVSCPYDFTGLFSGGDGFVNLDESPFSPNFIGEFLSLGGWVATEAGFSGTTEKGVTIYKTFSPAIMLNYAELHYNLSKGSFSHGTGITRNLIQLSHSGTVLATNAVFSDADSDGFNKVLALAGSYTVDRIDLRVHSSWRNDPDPVAGNCQITQFNYNLPGGGCS